MEIDADTSAVYGLCATCGASLQPQPVDIVDGCIVTVRDNHGTHHNRCWNKPKRNRIAELEAALQACIEWAGSDCEHEACKGVIETAERALRGATVKAA